MTASTPVFCASPGGFIVNPLSSMVVPWQGMGVYSESRPGNQSAVKRELSGQTGCHLPNIYIFNGLGYQILKENPVILGRRVKLASRISRLRLIREILKKVHIQGMSYSGIYLPYGLIPTLEKHFERIESSGEEVFRNSFHGRDLEGILAAYHEYQEEFQKRELVIYDMQVSLCNQLLENQELAAVYARAFRYIMVDEFQDVSADNAQMVYTIAKHHNNLLLWETMTNPFTVSGAGATISCSNPAAD